MMALLLRANLVLFLAFSASWMQRSTAQSPCSNDEVRLVGGRALREGRVEICVNQQWGTVCSNSWDISDAGVVCRQLGYPAAATAYTDGYRFGYGSASGPIHLDDIECSSLVDRLISCSHNNDTSDCSHSIDAGVYCNATPRAPQVSTRNIGSRSLTLQWTTPQTYGIGIQRYNIKCPTQEAYTYTASSSSKDVSGLHPDTRYSCCVSATNVDGDVGTRGCTTVTTREDVPTAAPQNVRGHKTGTTSLYLYWSLPPSQHRNGHIQYYNIHITEVNTHTQRLHTSTGLQTTINSLHPHYTYDCRVAAYTIGEGPLSPPVTITTGEAKPSAAPQSVSGYQRDSTSIYLSWSPPPLPDQNGHIRMYNIYVHEVETGTQTQHTSTDLLITIYSLHPYYSYECKVAAYTIGEGIPSQPVTITTDEDKPTAAPQNVNGYATDSTSIFLSWSPPPLPDQNGRIRQYYIYIYEVETGAQTRHTSTDHQAVIHSLHPYYTYKCRVAAYTISEGPQHQLPVIIKTLQDIPSAPPENITTTDVSTTHVYLNWIPPPTEHHNGIIIGYVVRVTKTNTRAQESYTLTSNTTELSVDSLTADSEYSFAVAAQTVMGIGPFSGVITQKTNPTLNSTAYIVAGVVAFLSILISAVLILGYIGYRKLRNKNPRRNDDAHVYDIPNGDITTDSKTARAEGTVHFQPQHGLQSKRYTEPGVQSKRNPKGNGKKNPTIALQNITFSLDRHTHKSLQDAVDKAKMDEIDPTVKLQSLTFSVNEHIHAFLEKNESPPPTKDPPLQQMTAPHEDAEDYNTKSEESDPTPKLQSFTFSVNEHMHAFLEQQPATVQSLDHEDASLDEDESPPPIPERLYLEQDDTHCMSNEYVAQALGEVMHQGVRVLPIVTQNGDQQMDGLGSEHIYQPLLSRPRRQEYEITQSHAKCQDQGQQMNGPASDHIYQPLLPHRLYSPAQQENTDYQSLRVVK